jgi:hypothetical protein
VSVNTKHTTLQSLTNSNRDLCDTAGQSWFYSETINTVTRTRIISSSSCPNHFSTCQEAVCGGEITTKAFRTDFYFEIPLYPVLALESTDTTCLNGTIGIALNGVSIHSMSHQKGSCVRPSLSSSYRGGSGLVAGQSCDLNGETDGLLDCGDAVQADSLTFDRCGGHASEEGVYHYHIPPACLIHQLQASASSTTLTQSDDDDDDDDEIPPHQSHSPQIGWSLDGFPIYGPIGPLGVTMRPCSVGAGEGVEDSLYCLDECNGLYAPLTGIDQYLYRYYLTGPVASETCQGRGESGGGCEKVEGGCCADALPSIEHRPYTLGCYRGCLLPLSNDDSPPCLSGSLSAVTDEFYPSLSSSPTEIYSSPSSSPPSSSPPSPPSLSPTPLPTLTPPSSTSTRSPYGGFGSTVVRYDHHKRTIGRIGVEKSTEEVTVELYETGGREAFITGMASLKDLLSSSESQEKE